MIPLVYNEILTSHPSVYSSSRWDYYYTLHPDSHQCCSVDSVVYNNQTGNKIRWRAYTNTLRSLVRIKLQSRLALFLVLWIWCQDYSNEILSLSFGCVFLWFRWDNFIIFWLFFRTLLIMSVWLGNLLRRGSFNAFSTYPYLIVRAISSEK